MYIYIYIREVLGVSRTPGMERQAQLMKSLQAGRKGGESASQAREAPKATRKGKHVEGVSALQDQEHLTAK